MQIIVTINIPDDATARARNDDIDEALSWAKNVLPRRLALERYNPAALVRPGQSVLDDEFARIDARR